MADKEQDRPAQDGVLRIFPPRGGEHEERLVETTRAYARGDFGSARRIGRQVKASRQDVFGSPLALT